MGSLRRLSDRIGPQLLRNCASAPDSVDLPYYMTTAADPINHTKKYLGRMYKLPKELLERFPEPTGGWSDKFLPRDFMRHGDLFGEHCLLIRRPALEVTHYLRQLDAKAEEGQGQADPVRFVLHGKYGNGKTTSLIHIHHYLINNPKVIVLNFGDFGLWSKRYRQMAESVYKAGRYDHIINSQFLLRCFAEYNPGRLDGLITTRDYKWSNREATPAGSPLDHIVAKGIDRPPFAADCLNVLLKELDASAAEGKCRVALLLDGINALFSPFTLIHKELPRHGRKRHSLRYVAGLLEPDQISVFRSLKKFVLAASKNTLLITTVDVGKHIHEPGREGRFAYISPDKRTRRMRPILESDLPFSLLSQEGWEAMDPFIPVHVPAYSEGEADVMIDYLADKKYLSHVATTEAGRAEIKFLTGRKPLDLRENSALW